MVNFLDLQAFLRQNGVYQNSSTEGQGYMKKFLSVLGAFAFAPLASLFAQEGAAAPKEGNLMQTVMMITVALAFFYFILWRPEQKRRKSMEKLRSSLKKGDRVTAMGILGTVSKVQDKTVILSLYDGAKIEVVTAAITEIQAPVVEEVVEKAPSNS